jgi:hypothetical protein
MCICILLDYSMYHIFPIKGFMAKFAGILMNSFLFITFMNRKQNSIAKF